MTPVRQALLAIVTAAARSLTGSGKTEMRYRAPGCKLPMAGPGYGTAGAAGRLVATDSMMNFEERELR
jgi:hypothetical protein